MVDPGSQTAGLEVTRDGAIVGGPQLGVPIPADSGEHVIEAKAPGRKPWRTVATVRGEASSTRVSIPELEQAPEETGAQTELAPTAADSGAQASGFGTQRVLALVAGGIGVVGIGVGTVFGLKSKSKHDEAEKYCTGAVCTDQLGVTAGKEAKDAGTSRRSQ